jgi:uncharacterized protein YciI
MIIANLTYIKPLAELDRVLDEHRALLAKWARNNILICSGPKDPRVGGIMMFNLPDVAAVETLMREDPFWRENMATYEYIVFTPVKCANGFNALIGKQA